MNRRVYSDMGGLHIGHYPALQVIHLQNGGAICGRVVRCGHSVCVALLVVLWCRRRVALASERASLDRLVDMHARDEHRSMASLVRA